MQVKDQGYEVCHNGDCITVFSAPNYCDQMGNKGELMFSQILNKQPTSNSKDSLPVHDHFILPRGTFTVTAAGKGRMNHAAETLC